MFVGTPAKSTTVSSGVSTDKKWHYITGVFDHNADEARMYVDGILEAPEDTLGTIYDQIGLPGFEKALPYFRSYIRQNANWPKQEYAYYSDELEQIREEWVFAFKKWGYEALEPV